MSNVPLIQRFDHLELYVGNAKQAARFYTQCFGFQQLGYQGLETGSREITSYLLAQGEIRLVISSALYPNHPIAQQVLIHGDHIAVIALAVTDATAVHQIALSHGAVSALDPTTGCDPDGTFRYAAIQFYGDTLIKFVERRSVGDCFAPNFHWQERDSWTEPGKGTVRSGELHQIDHVVGNVPIGEMERWVSFCRDTMQFSLLTQFADRAIATEHSALVSKVMQSPNRQIKLPINEPAPGKHKSQITEYLEYNQGAGVQHVAFSTTNILQSITHLRSRGIEFLSVPASYYEQLADRVGEIAPAIADLASLGILVDRDREGYLLQIFTQPLQDRPTLFFEIIERRGSQGFGEGNFKSLFEAVEREQSLRGNLAALESAPQ